MALCLAISLVSRCDFIPYDQLVRYKWWYNYGYMSSTGRCFDIGAATSDSLNKFERRQQSFAASNNISMRRSDYLSDPQLLKKFDVMCSGDGVAGNGALMRLAPVPLFFYKYPFYAVEYSGLSGKLTHGDKKAYDACRYYGALIVAALHGTSKEELLADDFYDTHSPWFGKGPLGPEIMGIAKGSYKRRGGYDEGIRGQGYIVNALEAALWAFWSEEDFEKGALAAVNLGDDTDTTAAIYGQLAGTYYGYNRLPKKWVRQVYAQDFLLGLSKWIAYEGQKWKPEKSLYCDPSISSQPSELHDSANSSSAHETSQNKTSPENQMSKPSLHQKPLEEGQQAQRYSRIGEQSMSPLSGTMRFDQNLRETERDDMYMHRMGNVRRGAHVPASSGYSNYLASTQTLSAINSSGRLTGLSQPSKNSVNHMYRWKKQ